MPTTPTPPPRIDLRDQPTLLAEMHAIFNEYAHALLADLPEGETRGVARGVVLRVNAGLVALEETARAEHKRRQSAALAALTAQSEEAGGYRELVLDRETAPAPREPDPESDELAEACVEVNCPRESAVPAAPATSAKVDAALGEFKAKVLRAEAAAGIGPIARQTAPKRETGFALLSVERRSEISRMGGKASAERRRVRSTEAAE
jgi:hypothetical protein